MKRHGWWIIAATVACAHAPPAAATRPALSSYYPLAVGNVWTYERNYLGERHEEQVQIVKLEDGYFVDNTGQQLAVDAFGIRDPKRYLLRGPLESGREWSNVVSVSSVEHYRIIDAGGGCESPAGKFQDCVRVESRNRIDAKTLLVNELTFAPQVGLVRVDVALEANGKHIPQTQLVLKAYQLASAAK
jgi:hypothetical protein